MAEYVVGIDYGTLSARALLIDLASGEEAAVSEFVYPHAVLPEDWFPGIRLSRDAALQHPQDYLDALQFCIRDILTRTGINAAQIQGIGVDFTSCTVLPVLDDGTPLCFLPEFRNEPHAYVKLWKHHDAEQEAQEMTDIAIQRKEPWLASYGGKISSEWMFPKILETLRKAPDVYRTAVRFVDAGDWITWQLTGQEVRSGCLAGYKALWSKDTGYPANDYFVAVDAALDGIIGTKVSEKVLPIGSKAGEVNSRGASLSGLAVGTAVAVSISDAPAALPGSGIVDSGKLMMIVGTSCCHFLLSDENHPIPGICGCVADGAVPGFYAYEAGQSCVGDCFGWFIENCVPEKYAVEARSTCKSIFSLLDEKAARLDVGESGLIALDWWNGNRSPYADFDLSGIILGLTLKTKPEEIYRAILESVAFGARAITDLFENNGVQIMEVYAAGGIARKNPFLMQIYADVLEKEIHICKTTQAGAKGSAVLAAAACGYYASVQNAAAAFADQSDITYYPNRENSKKYAKLYTEYNMLSKYFTSENTVMKRLKK